MCFRRRRIEVEPERTLLQEVKAFRNKFRDGSAGWAVVYHLTLFGAAVLSASAALFIKLSDMENLAAVLATAAAVLTTLSSVGDFQRKWHADRDAFYALDELLIRAKNPEALDDSQIKRLLVGILRTQHGSWTRGVGGPSDTGDDNSGGRGLASPGVPAAHPEAPTQGKPG